MQPHVSSHRQYNVRETNLMTPSTSDSTILVPVDVSEPATPARGLVELLHPLRIVLLGYYPVPDQTTPDQFQQEHGEEAAADLDRIAEPFVDREATVESIVVFTRDRSKTIDRIANEYDCDAVLTTGDVDALTDVLVPLKGDVNLDRIVTFVGELLGENDASVMLFHAATDEEDAEQSEFILRGVADRLTEIGIDEDRIDWSLAETNTPEAEIVAVSAAYDLVVIGESEPSLKDRILGDVPTGIIDRVDSPVLVVRRSS